MPQNTTPVFTGIPSIQWGYSDGDGGTTGPLKTANTARDGSGTLLTVFTANATNGGFLKFLRVTAAGTNIATVLRIFINNGSSNSSTNNILYDEIALQKAFASNYQADMLIVTIPMNFWLPAGYRIQVSIGTTISAGILVIGVGGDNTAGSGNATPTYGQAGDIQWSTTNLTGTNSALDGTGSNVLTAFTADATNGGWVSCLRIVPRGSNTGTGVFRVFLNNGSVHTSAANNMLWTETTWPTTTASAVLPDGRAFDIPLNVHLPAGYAVLVTCDTQAAPTDGFSVLAIGTKF
jgi:hypothetical protein